MSRKKRRSYSAEFKFQIVLEVLRGERSAAQICRDHKLREEFAVTMETGIPRTRRECL